MRIKRHSRAWGEEVIIGEGAQVVRIYTTVKKVTIDLSQVRDATWGKFIKVQEKYPNCTKIELPVDTDVEMLIRWWMS